MSLFGSLQCIGSATRNAMSSGVRYSSSSAVGKPGHLLTRSRAPWRSPKHAQQNGPTPYEHKAHREGIKKKFPDGWNPPTTISRESMDMLRAMHNARPEVFSTPVLAAKFKISPEAVRRILKSKWTPDKAREAQLLSRERTSKQIWYENKIRHEYEVDPQGDRPVRAPGDRLYFGEEERPDFE